MAINVHTTEGIPAEDDRDMRWFAVDVNDGTIPAPIKVYMPVSGWIRLTNHVDDTNEWIRDRLRHKVKDVPEVDQLSALRKLSPIELSVPEFS